MSQETITEPARMYTDIPDVIAAEGLPSSALINMSLRKSNTLDDDNGTWSFKGIASDETADEEGDKILKKALDVSYAQKRGYVNWDHSRQPGDQIGFLTKCVTIEGPELEAIQKSMGIPVATTASVYVEGELYKHIPKAVEVRQILKSLPEDRPGSLGLSLDGVVARDAKNGGVVKAFVRGVALTPAPMHPMTVALLKKSLKLYSALSGPDGELPANLVAELAKSVADQLIPLIKGEKTELHITDLAKSDFTSKESAVLWLLKQRPHWTYGIASQVVDYTLTRKQKGS